MRLFAIFALLSLAAGCGVAPTPAAATTASEATAPPTDCPPGYTQEVPYQARRYDSSTNPWGSVTGIIVSYPTDTTFQLFGYDPSQKLAIWYMLGATRADIDRFEQYPQTIRYCGISTDNGGAGSGKGFGDPHPHWFGACVPPSIQADAVDAASNGPSGGDSVADYCALYGKGGCVPQSCDDLGLGCGRQVDNCGQPIYCGPCSPPHGCPCGGAYPNHCLLCQ